jgi:5'(3')-deoxyribonucleotidase
MRVAVDLEDVLVDCNSRFIKRLNSFIKRKFPESNLSFQRSDISAWAFDGVREPFSELVGWEEDLIEKFMYGHGDWKGYIPITEEIWRKETGKIPWMEGDTENKLKTLQEKVENRNGEIHLVTARRRVNDSVNQKLDERNLNKIFDKVVVKSEKYRLDYRFYIDDNPNLFPNLSGNQVQLVRKQPWNRDSRVEKPHRKVDSIEESAEVIGDLD